MFRRVLLGVLLLCGLFTAASANAFNPATQSHWGACARETDQVAQAVHDYAANGVAVDFARLLALHGRNGALVGLLRRRLVVGTVESSTVTQNHGCDGTGQWFAVGPRLLSPGEHVAVRLGPRLRRRACVRSDRECRRITVEAHVVLPTNCWNPNMGSVRVALYVHRVVHSKPVRKPKPKPKHGSKPYRPAPPPLSTPSAPASPTVTTAEPLASAALSCETDAVQVTIANAASATAPATFEVQGTAHGPLAPGASETVIIPLPPGQRLTLTVTSGPAMLIAGEQLLNECRAEPVAGAEFVKCVQPGPQGFGIEVAVTVADGAGATLPASFIVEWPGPTRSPEGKAETVSEAVGPLAPGEQKTLLLDLNPFELSSTVTVSSGGKTILRQSFTQRCVEAG